MQQDESKALADYRDLYLDRSRALYELDIKTDLGDTMTQTSAARLRGAATRDALALAWAQVDALLGGRPLEAALTAGVKESGETP